jgi:DNA polymerase III delta prime subunit
MEDKTQLFPVDLYHSYVVEGEPKETANVILRFLEDRGDIERKSPDTLLQIYESLTIDDALLIKGWHSQLGITNGKKVCVIAAKFINREAEQTLLKIIEEPAKGTHFFIVVPDASLLLDTIISRTHIVKIEQSRDKDLEKLVGDFMKMEPKERIEKITEMIKENKDEESSGRLRSFATNFINEIEKVIHLKFKKDTNDKNTIFILEELQKSRGYLSTPGASVKIILENIALIV